MNLGTGRGQSVKEIVEAVGRATGREVPARFAPRRPGDPPVLVADPVAGRADAGLEGQVDRHRGGDRLGLGLPPGAREAHAR